MGYIPNESLVEIPGVLPPRIEQDNYWTCWFYLLRIDEETLGCDRVQFVEALCAEGMPASAGYIAAPLYQYPIFQDENFFAGQWPAKEMGLTTVDYKAVSCPVAEEILRACVCVGVHESRTEEWARQVGNAVTKVAKHFALANQTASPSGPAVPGEAGNEVMQ